MSVSIARKMSQCHIPSSERDIFAFSVKRDHLVSSLGSSVHLVTDFRVGLRLSFGNCTLRQGHGSAETHEMQRAECTGGDRGPVSLQSRTGKCPDPPSRAARTSGVPGVSRAREKVVGVEGSRHVGFHWPWERFG